MLRGASIDPAALVDRMLAALQLRDLGHLRHGGACMGVGDGQAQGVGGIGAGQAGQLQQAAHHFLDLALGRAAMAGHGLLHLQCRVFGDRQARIDQGRERGAARLAQQQRGLGVDVDEDDFHGRGVGLVAAGDFRDAVEQQLEPARQVAERDARGADGAAGHVGQAVAVDVDHAESRGLQTGVDSKDAHGVNVAVQGTTALGILCMTVRVRCSR